MKSITPAIILSLSSHGFRRSIFRSLMSNGLHPFGQLSHSSVQTASNVSMSPGGIYTPMTKKQSTPSPTAMSIHCDAPLSCPRSQSLNYHLSSTEPCPPGVCLGLPRQRPNTHWYSEYRSRPTILSPGRRRYQHPLTPWTYRPTQGLHSCHSTKYSMLQASRSRCHPFAMVCHVGRTWCRYA